MTVRQTALEISADRQWHTAQEFHDKMPHWSYSFVRRTLQVLVRRGTYERRYATPGPNVEYRQVKLDLSQKG